MMIELFYIRYYGVELVSHKKGAGLVSHPLSYYLANKRSLHIHSQGIKILTLIKKKERNKITHHCHYDKICPKYPYA